MIMDAATPLGDKPVEGRRLEPLPHGVESI